MGSFLRFGRRRREPAERRTAPGSKKVGCCLFGPLPRAQLSRPLGDGQASPPLLLAGDVGDDSSAKTDELGRRQSHEVAAGAGSCPHPVVPEEGAIDEHPVDLGQREGGDRAWLKPGRCPDSLGRSHPGFRNPRRAGHFARISPPIAGHHGHHRPTVALEYERLHDPIEIAADGAGCLRRCPRGKRELLDARLRSRSQQVGPYALDWLWPESGHARTVRCPPRHAEACQAHPRP